jgi:gamma-glutamyltranspeptidase / glutathione hydrolase
VENGISAEIRRGLEARGHRVRPGGPFGGGQMIVIGEDGFLTAGSDPRKDGMAAGW